MKVICTRFYQGSDILHSRINAYDEDKNQVWISPEQVPVTDHYRVDGDHKFAAEQLCLKMDWPGIMVGGHLKKNCMVWVFVDHLHSPFTDDQGDAIDEKRQETAKGKK